MHQTLYNGTVNGFYFHGGTVFAALCWVLLVACGQTQTGEPSGDTDTLDGIEAEIAQPACPTVEILPIGWVDVDPVTGLSSTIPVLVPDDALSMLVLLEGDSSAFYALTRMVDPEGTELIPEGWTSTANGPVCLACVNRIAASRQTHAALIPNAPSVDMVGGQWSFQFMAFSDSDFTPLEAGASVSVVVKRGETLPDTGALQLQVLIPTALQNLPPDDRGNSLSVMTSQLASVFAQVGITMEAPHQTIVDWPAAWLLDDLQSNTHTLPETLEWGVPVLLVDELTVGANPLAGFSPVPGGRPFAAGLGVTIVVPEAPGELDDLGTAMAHELGHYLGLWHTREAGGQGVLDPLPDTPAVSDDNLMTVDLLGSILTDGQGQVMRGHPAITHSCAP
jgi:hypothetical protein